MKKSGGWFFGATFLGMAFLGTALCITLGMGLCPAWAQSVAQSSAQVGGQGSAQSGPPTFRAETALVLVPTLVTTAQGRVVFGLRATDFVVTDNGVEQQVWMDETFAGRPVSLVIAVQRGGRAAEILGGGCLPPGRENVFTKQAGKCVSPMHGIAGMLETFVSDSGSEMALVSFDSQVRLRHNFTGQADEVTKELETLPAGDGGSAILDAIQYSLGLLRQRPEDQRRVLVVISEETDRGSSHIGLEEAARQIASTNTEIYMVAMANSDGKEALRMVAQLLGPSLTMLGHMPVGAGEMGGMRGRGSQEGTGTRQASAGDDGAGDANGAAQAGAGTDAMQTWIPLSRSGAQSGIPQTIANLTGGEYVRFSDGRGLDEALGLLANHAHNRYQLSYRVKSSEPGLHRISVSLREAAGVYVAARSSYWLAGPADHPAGSSAK